MFLRNKFPAIFFLCAMVLSMSEARAQDQYVSMISAYPIRLPGGRLPEAGIVDAIDCNSPVHWDANGIMHVFTSVRHPFRSTGNNLFNLSSPTIKTTIVDAIGVTGGKWLEATYRDPDGTLYGWYHNEPPDVCSNDPHLSAPRIGAMVSRDEGLTWADMGIIIEAPADSLNCLTRNYYFAGGNGDFSVIVDQDKRYFYFFLGTYHSQLEEQGISIARMSFADRNAPVGTVWKWRNGRWEEPGLGGRVTPVFAVEKNWHGMDPDAFWGPSIHYNYYLNMYVILLNRAVNTFWQQEGVYITYNLDLANPAGWSEPERLPFDAQGWAYPQVIGLNLGDTDKLAGRYARLFLLGQSYWLLTFHRTPVDEDTCEDCLPPAPPRPGKPIPPPAAQMIRSARPSFLTDLDNPSKRPERPNRNQ